MNIEMVPLEIIGLKSNLQAALHALRGLGCIHIEEISESSEVLARPLNLDHDTLKFQEDLSLLTARVDGLLEIVGCGSSPAPSARSGDCIIEARAAIEEVMTKVQSLTSRRD